MTFVVTKNKTVWWPISVSVPKDEGGVQIRTFQARFEILPKSRIDALQKDAIAAIDRQGRGDDSASYDTDMQASVLREATQDTKDLVNEQEESLAFSAELLDGLLEVPYVRAAMFQAYGDAAAGRKAKN